MMISPRTQKSGGFFSLIEDMEDYGILLEDFVTVLSLEICRKYGILNEYDSGIVRLGSRSGGVRGWLCIAENGLPGATGDSSCWLCSRRL